MQIIKLIIVSLLATNIAIADSVVPIQKGQVAPYEGVLFDTEAANNLRTDKLDLQYLRKSEEVYKKNESLYLDRLKIKDDEIERLSKKDTKILGLDGGFVGGVALTILLGFVVKKAYQ
jgi:hypothetical protein